jgi:hypothetical protein
LYEVLCLYRDPYCQADEGEPLDDIQRSLVFFGEPWS